VLAAVVVSKFAEVGGVWYLGIGYLQLTDKTSGINKVWEAYTDEQSMDGSEMRVVNEMK